MRCFGKTAERHTSAEFVAFLTDIVTHQPKGKEIHVIAENLSRRTPTYSSWLNQVELWFGKNKQPKPVKWKSLGVRVHTLKSADF